MSEPADEWSDAAAEDLSAAVDLLRSGHPLAAAFHAHQCVEKVLKSRLLRDGGRIERSHDLVRLARIVKAPPAIEAAAAALAPYYTAARYPDIPGAPDAAAANEALARAQEVMAWIRST